MAVGLTSESLDKVHKSIRASLSSSRVTITHEEAGEVYTGTRTRLDTDQTISGMGSLQNADGAIRLIVSDLIIPHPKSGDIIRIDDTDTNEQVTRSITSAEYDSGRGSLLITYGAQYGRGVR